MRTSNKAEWTPAQFVAWQTRRGLTNSGAAAALGLSRRTVDYLRSGEAACSLTIVLATEGADARALATGRRRRSPTTNATTQARKRGGAS